VKGWLNEPVVWRRSWLQLSWYAGRPPLRGSFRYGLSRRLDACTLCGAKIPTTWYPPRWSKRGKGIRHFSDIGAARLCAVVHFGQRTPSLGVVKTRTCVYRGGYEPGGREFESLRARQLSPEHEAVTATAAPLPRVIERWRLPVSGSFFAWCGALQGFASGRRCMGSKGRFHLVRQGPRFVAASVDGRYALKHPEAGLTADTGAPRARPGVSVRRVRPGIVTFSDRSGAGAEPVEVKPLAEPSAGAPSSPAAIPSEPASGFGSTG
jgi:hypothetical protein